MHVVGRVIRTAAPSSDSSLSLEKNDVLSAVSPSDKATRKKNRRSFKNPEKKKKIEIENTWS